MNHHNRFLMAGVMGWPVMHSRSPLMHNHWFAQEKLNGVYVPLAIHPNQLEGALRGLFPLGFSGCNLTIPHKQNAMSVVDEVDAVAQKMGAISCVTVKEGGRLVGTNNDAAGFIRNVKEFKPHWNAAQGPIVVIGAGGGSRAVCQGLIQEGAEEIRLVNRSLERAQTVMAELGAPIHAHPWSDRADLMAGASMVVNTTSQGMVGQTPLDIQLDLLPTHALVTDIVYTPLETPLLKQARLRGNETLDGLGMLLHQGPLGWKAWFGIEPKVTPELRALIVQSLT
jgi:shikimate dehydrogenase